MTRLGRIRRRPDHWGSAHARARARAAERLDGPLGLAESTWLDEHLAACAACAATAASYETDRRALRALAANPPEAPRDLWARTAAAIERESAGATTRSGQRATGVERRLPVGVLSGIAVIAVVAGVTALSGGGPFGPLNVPDGGVASSPATLTPPGDTASRAPAAEPTPIIVGAGDVAWVDRGPGGALGYSAAAIDKVCPADGPNGCAVLNVGQRSTLGLIGAPRTIIGSPSGAQAMAISEDDQGRDRIVILQLPRPEPTAEPTSTPSPTASPGSTTTNPPTPTPTPEVTVEGSPPPDPSGSPTISPEPTVAAAIAIATGIEVIGEAAAFSSDGAWFAFTARPADGSGGPDVYVWHVGDEQARPLTSGGSTYFASWSGDHVIASRPVDSDELTSSASSVRIEPLTGVESDLGHLWRPIVDPSGSFVIVWDGSIGRSEATGTWAPAEGALELRAWSDEGVGPPRGSGRDRIVTDEAIGGYDVRWDETGEWVAVWVADPLDAVIGSLSLYRLDREEGRLERIDGSPVGVPALSGFSIGDGRLAWATPRGQGGEGSRIQIAAWLEGDVGTVEGAPAEGIIVVR